MLVRALTYPGKDVIIIVCERRFAGSGVFVTEAQDEIRRKIRIHRNNLYTLGNGIIAVGVWSVIQLILRMLNTPEVFMPATAAENIPSELVMLTAAVSLALLLGISIGLYIFAGARARAEGLGKRQKPFYIVLTGLLAVIHVLSVIYVISAALIPDIKIGMSPMGMVVSVIVDLTSVVAMTEMIHSAVMIRIYEHNETAGKQ